MTTQINHQTKKEKQVKQHTFRSQNLKLQTFCIQSSRIILGLGKQSIKCQHAYSADNASCNSCILPNLSKSPKSVDTISNYQNGSLTLNILSFSTGTRKSVQIDIKEARNLVGLKKNGLSDPCMLCLLPLLPCRSQHVF